MSRPCVYSNPRRPKYPTRYTRFTRYGYIRNVGELSTFHNKSTVALTSAETKEYDASYPVTALTIPLLNIRFPEYYTPKRGNSICPQNQDRIPCMATTLANTRNNRVRNVKRVCGIPQLHRRNDRPTPPDMSVAETTKELTDAV
jgi:hypothetical protein